VSDDPSQVVPDVKRFNLLADRSIDENEREYSSLACLPKRLLWWTIRDSDDRLGASGRVSWLSAV
jgi:hypothetical protein